MIYGFDRKMSVLDILQRNDCDPLQILSELATGDFKSLKNVTDKQLSNYSLRLRYEAACELAQYVYAKMKPRDDDSDLEDYAAAVLILPDNGTST